MELTTSIVGLTRFASFGAAHAHQAEIKLSLGRDEAGTTLYGIA
jgi:hypothetical protein